MTISFTFFAVFDYYGRWVGPWEAQRERVRPVKALPEGAELEVLRLKEAVLRLEGLPLNSLLPERAQLVTLQLKEQLVEFEQLERWLFQDFCQNWLLEGLLHNLLRHVELILAELRRREKLRRQAEMILVEPRPREELICRFLAMLRQKLLESLLFSGNVSEFPNKH